MKRRTSANLNPAIQDSLKRLNMAAVNVNASQSGVTSPTSPKSASVHGRTESNTSFSVASTSVSTTKLEKVLEVATLPVAQQQDTVTAIHDFTARTDRELSFKKGDVLGVK